MGLKLDFDKLNDEEKSFNDSQKEKAIEVSPNKTESVEEPQVTVPDGEFSLGNEFEEEIKNEENNAQTVVEPEPVPVPVKKAFEGHNKDILSKPMNVEKEKNEINTNLPDISLDVIDDTDFKINESEVINNIHKRTESKIKSVLEQEIEREKNIANPQNEHVTKVLCIGGNEQYYKTVLTKLNKTNKNIEFVKYVAAAGKNAFLIIDAVQPDIIMIYHNAQIKNALQFYDAVMNESDNNGQFYRDKYKDKRIIVVSSNDISYEIKLREKGINFYVKELNPKTHAINIEELIGVINDAQEDIDKIKRIEIERKEKKQEEEILQLADEDNSLNNIENKDIDDDVPNIPDINLNIVKDNNYDVDDDTAEIEKDETDNGTKEESVDNNIAKPSINVDNEIVMTEAQWRKKQMSRQRDNSNVDENGNNEGKIIGIYSTTGGSGKTMFASNLSSILAKYGNQDGSSNYRVALVEYNLTCKCLDIFFNIKTNKNVMSLARDVSNYIAQDKENNSVINITPEQFAPFVKSNMHRIPELNLDILPGISSPLEIDNIPNNFTNCLFQTLKTMYDVIIVDTGADIAKTAALESFNMIDEIYYIIPMDVSAIRNTKVLLGFFTGMFRYDEDKIKIIINKVNQENEEFGVDQIFQAFAIDNYVPEGIIPVDNKITSSINRGVPIAIEDATNPVSTAIYSIALGINERMSADEALPVEEKEEKGFFSKIFGGKKKSNKNNKVVQVPKEKNKSLFKSKSENVAVNVNNSPKVEKKHGGFFNKKKKENHVDVDNNQEIVIPKELSDNPVKPKKKGFLGGLFGGKKKEKNNAPKIKNKKKNVGLGGLLGKSKKDENDSVINKKANNQESNQLSAMNNQNGLQTLIRRQPRKR